LLSYGFAINIMPDLNNAMQVIWTVVGTPNGEQPDWSNEYFMFWSTWWYIIWNVGLGTKVPWPYKLFVQWDTNIEWKLTTNDLEIENNLHVQWNLSASGATTLWWPLWVYGPTKIDGRVGIWVNTLSTYYKLEVNGPTNIQWDLFAPNINASANVNVSWDVKIDNDAYWRDAYFRNLNANGGVNVSGDVRVNTDVYGRDAYFRNLFASGWFFSGLVADTITWWNWFFSGLSVGNLVVSWSFTLPPGDEDQVLMTKNWEADRHTLPLDLTWASGQTLRRVDGKWTKSSIIQNLWNKVLIKTDTSIEWWVTIWDKNVACNATEQWTVRYDWSCFWWCNGSTWTTIGTCSCAANEYHEPDVWCVSNNAQNGSCVSYPSTYGAQPAIDTVSACTIWIYTDTTDTYNQRKRSCMGVQWWATVSCSANKDARCGNWVRDTGEMCDDWDRTDWDWCNASCNVEPGRNCVWSPSMCVNAIWSGDDGDTLVIASWQIVTSKVIRNLWTQVIINKPTVFESNIFANIWVNVGNSSLVCEEAQAWLIKFDWTCFVWCDWEERVDVFSCVICGDWELGWWEACDDWNTTSWDGCNATCTQQEPWYVCETPWSLCRQIECWDWIVDAPETCDDWGTSNWDWCSSTCTIEWGTGWTWGTWWTGGTWWTWWVCNTLFVHNWPNLYSSTYYIDINNDGNDDKVVMWSTVWWNDWPLTIMWFNTWTNQYDINMLSPYSIMWEWWYQFVDINNDWYLDLVARGSFEWWSDWPLRVMWFNWWTNKYDIDMLTPYNNIMTQGWLQLIDINNDWYLDLVARGSFEWWGDWVLRVMWFNPWTNKYDIDMLTPYNNIMTEGWLQLIDVNNDWYPEIVARGSFVWWWAWPLNILWFNPWGNKYDNDMTYPYNIMTEGWLQILDINNDTFLDIRATDDTNVTSEYLFNQAINKY